MDLKFIWFVKGIYIIQKLIKVESEQFIVSHYPQE